MPRKRARKKQEKRPSKFIFYIAILVVFSLVAISVFHYKAQTKIVLVSGGEPITVSVFDFVDRKITRMEIPGNTQVSVAKNLGDWELGAVEKIAANEGSDLGLLSNTVIKNFKFPVTHWGGRGDHLKAKRMGTFFGALLLAGNSNLTFFDKLDLLYLFLTTPNSDKSTINLTQTNYVRPGVLDSGNDGYVVSENPPALLFSYFGDVELSGNSTIHLIDETGDYDATFVKDVVGFMGAQITLVDQSVEGKYDCYVRTKQKDKGVVLAKVLGCELSSDNQLNSDLEIHLGEGFAKRF